MFSHLVERESEIGDHDWVSTVAVFGQTLWMDLEYAEKADGRTWHSRLKRREYTSGIAIFGEAIAELEIKNQSSIMLVTRNLFHCS